MMLGYIRSHNQGQGDTLLADLAQDLSARGLRLAGAVQMNLTFDPQRPCHMDLHVLPGKEVVRISQDLGAGASGCRLDAQSLEAVVGLVARALQKGPQLLIINKFGRHEGEGRGFRPLIGEALQMGVPVITAVSALNIAGFEAFAEGVAEAVAAEPLAMRDWCLSRIG